MPSQKKNSKKMVLNRVLSALKNIFTINIGTILFGVIFIYMLISAILYLTSSHFTTYQVISGPLSRNETYTGLALHTEEVVSAASSGYVNYYAREGNKINANGTVYGISTDKVQADVQPLSQEDLLRIRRQMNSFSYGFNPSSFNKTYSFKYELEGNILQYSGANTAPVIPDTQDEESQDTSDTSSEAAQVRVSTTTLGNQTLCNAPKDGIVLYSKDGYEDKTADNLKASDFDRNSYQKTDLKTDKPIKAGEDIYTLVSDERWSLIIPLSEKQAAQLADKTAIRVKFLKDGISQTGMFSMLTIDGSQYGKLDFSNGLIRYATDRFLDIELVTNIQSGLKIPVSSIVSKEFYVIPEDYKTVGGNDNEAGFQKETRNKKGETVSEFVSATLYAHIDGKYYVEKSLFKEGDMLLKPESSDKYKIGETAKLEGVYCVNKGYAVFRRITIIDQNEEYCIVEKGTSYGLAQYDNIVQDAEKVNEEDILY